MNLWTKRTTVQINPFEIQMKEDTLINETVYHFYVNGSFAVSFACTPKDLDFLAAGYAFTHQFIRTKEHIKSLKIDEQNQLIHMETLDSPPVEDGESLEAGTDAQPNDGPFFTQNQIFRLWKRFDEQSALFLLTGSAHSAALTDGENILILMEDVARHNALDKVIGKVLLQDIDASGLALVFSGRVARDMVLSASCLNTKVMLCHGASTAGAVALAEEKNMTLAGFVSEKRINIYCHSSRIQFER